MPLGEKSLGQESTWTKITWNKIAGPKHNEANGWKYWMEKYIGE